MLCLRSQGMSTGVGGYGGKSTYVARAILLLLKRASMTASTCANGLSCCWCVRKTAPAHLVQRVDLGDMTDEDLPAEDGKHVEHDARKHKLTD